MKKLQMLTAFAGAALFAGGAYADDEESTGPEVVTVTSAEEFTAFIADGTITGGTVFTLSNNNLVAWLRFDESATKDECGNVWTPSGTATLSETGAKAGTCLKGGSAILNDTTLDLREGWTFDFWCYGIAKNYVNALSFATGKVYNQFLFVPWHGDGNAFFCSMAKSTVRPDWDTYRVRQTNTPRNGLHHYAITFVGQTYTVFVNGAKIGSANFSATGVTLASRIATGASSNAHYTDEFRIHKGVLWTANFTPPTVADYEGTLTLSDLTIPSGYSVIHTGSGEYRFTQGLGTKSSPYVIKSAAEFDAWKARGGYFALSGVAYDDLTIPSGAEMQNLGGGKYMLVTGTGETSSPYLVANIDQFNDLLASNSTGTVAFKLVANTAIAGSVHIPSSFESVTIDMNGGSITGNDGEPGISVDIGTYLSLTGIGTVSGGGTAAGLDIRPRVTVGSSVAVNGGGLLTLEVNGIRLIYRGQEDVSDIERLIRLILESGITPVQAGK